MTPVRRFAAAALVAALGSGFIGLGATAAHADTTWGFKSKGSQNLGDTTWGFKSRGSQNLGDTTWGFKIKTLD
ncbi:hypothetical protein [Nocardioides oleivorans]|uniref:hypothetical protein n=1 Tax=Nocardioides oleivorans TaxID=273676 RepID=UPI0013EB3E3E|nr:hypothetical protein [Nocardioides oleivorans]